MSETGIATDEIERSPGKLVAWVVLVVLVAVDAYATRFTSGKPAPNVLYEYSTAGSSAVAYAILLSIVLAISGLNPRLLALCRPVSWLRALGTAALVLIPVYFVIEILDQVLHGGREQGLTPAHWEPSHAGAYAANFVVVAVMAPVVEELTFRGLGFSLLQRFGKWTAIIVVGLTFAAAHGLVEAYVELLIFGCALAWLRWRTKSVFPGMLVHAAFNALALILAVSS